MNSDVDPQEFGEVMADVRNLTESLKKYNGKISENSKHIVELREDFIRITNIIENLMEARTTERKQIEDLQSSVEKIAKTASKTSNKLATILSVMTIIGSGFLLVPKFFPEWSPFITKNGVEELIKEKTITEESIEDIVTSVVDTKVPVIVSEVLKELEFDIVQ